MMPVLRKRGIHENKSLANGLYVHSSPPKVLQITSAHLKQLIRTGDVERLEHLVLDGQGKKLIGEYSADYKTRTFLKSVPTMMSKISLLHDAVNSDRLEELQNLLEEEPAKKKKYILAKDESGVGLLHKAVYYDLKEIYQYLIHQFPQLVSIKDTEGRTPYHYTPMCKDCPGVQRLLVTAGADPNCLDYKQHSAKYYVNHLQELELPSHQKSHPTSRKSTANPESLNFKKSNIRIWIHQRNLTNLQQVVWEGHGSKLLVEHSNNPKIKKFLEAVPHIMGLIKEIHTDVQNGNLDSLKSHVASPIPPVVLSGKDNNGLTPLHKAVGLGKKDVAEFIVSEYPNSVNIQDNEGRTPLHYAAILKDDGEMMKYLIDNGADESALDHRQKTAAYYKNRASELDTKVLSQLPECPRSAKDSFAANFDWSMLSSTAGDVATKLKKTLVNNNVDQEIKPEKLENGNIPGHENGNETEHENNNEPEHEADVLGNTESNQQEETSKNETEDEIPQDHEPEEIHDENENILEDSHANDDKEESNSVEHEEETKPEDEPEEAAEQEDKPGNPEEKESEEDAKEEMPEEAEEAPTNENINETVETAMQEGSRPSSKLASRPSSNMIESNEPEVDAEGVIEGVVNGENEIETLNEEGQNNLDDKFDDDDIKNMVQTGNMEQLAALVLNGNGEKLVGQTSDNPELQTFLENVPVYMSKIKRIHVAARDGSLRDLQAALDRRKFAIAKDPISPKGATPLHVSVIFGNTSIVRYLAGRFPETIQAVDDEGRTPLHYAATLADNGHYYNLLVHLGADTRVEDLFGHTAEYYRTHSDEFSHRSLLTDFGTEESAVEEILFDKDNPNLRNDQVDMPFFATEEGRYLASSLGDPLIKGLTEVANKRPEDPIAYLATYLYNFANNRSNPKSRGRTQDSESHIIAGSPQTVNDNNSIPASIDVVTVEPDDENNSEDSAFNMTSRDEHGQSMLHFAAARAHGRNAMFQLLLETEINVAYRDELYRTARDISIQANIAENTAEIDRYVLHIATKGDTDKLVELLLDGYDHITDIVDSEGVPIVGAVSKENQLDTVSFLQSILAFEEKRERVHHAIRQGSINDVRSLLADENDTGSGKLLAIGKNSYGRCTLHIAVLCQQEEIVDYIANTFPDTLKLGDNLERTALHYSMGVEKMESISRLLIKAGAKRVTKDLKGRQPTYYFLNKSEILRLQEEEETF